MNPVLLHLVWVESRAIVRLAVRRLATKRGLLAAAAALVLLAGVPYGAYLSVARAGNFAATIQFMRNWAPEAFFLFVMLGAIAPRGLYYRPPELALLFPAPLPRRQLVLYNIVWRARMSLLSASWLALLGVLGGTLLPVALVGYGLILLLLQVSSQWFAVVRARLAARDATLSALCYALTVLIVLGWLVGGPVELLSKLAWATRPALLVVSSRTLGEASPWAAIVIAVIATLATATCAMDDAYHDVALARSLDRRKRRRTRSGAGSYGPSVHSAWLKLPAFPYLGGAGPIAWRQSLELLRNPRRIVLVLAIVVASAFGALVVVHLEAGSSLDVMSPSMRAWTIVVVLCVAPLLSGDSLGFDFRRDLDRMATLKSFPISPVALSVGQLAPAALFVTVVQMVGIAVVAIGSESLSFASALVALIVIAPLNWTAIAVENTLFLVAPYRTVVDDPGDMTFAGRLALATTLKMASLMALTLVGVAVAVVTMLATRGSQTATVAALAAVLGLACVPATRLAGWAFARFDVGRDVPA